MAGGAPKITYAVADDTDLEGLMNGYSGPRLNNKDFDYVIITLDDPYNVEKAQEEANKAIDGTEHAGKTTKVIVIKKDSLKGNEKQKLLNKIAMFNEIYEASEEYQLSKAESDLKDKHTIAYKMYDYVEPEQDPNPDPTQDPESQT